MAQSGLLIGTSAIAIGGAAIGLSAGSAPPSGRTHKLVLSFKEADGDIFTNALLAFGGLANVKVSGADRYNAMYLQPQGHKGDGGNPVTLPADTGIGNVNDGAIWYQFDDHPDYYTGETFVYRVRSGNLGAGNSLRIFNALTGATSTIDTDPTSYRVEKVIDDASEGENVIPYIDITDETTLDNPVREFFLKKHEALVDDGLNNPYKLFNPDFRARIDAADVLRPMDLFYPMFWQVSHMLDIGKVDDEAWMQKSATYGLDFDLQCYSPTGRSGVPFRAVLDLCENGSPSGNPWIAWLSLPLKLNSPWRHTIRSYGGNALSYWEDGVQTTGNVSDAVGWIDKRWVQLSSITVETGPSHGTFSVDTDTGQWIYSPKAGANPWTHTSGNQQETIVIRCNPISYSGDAQTPTVGASTTFEINLTVVALGGELYWIYPSFRKTWQTNTDWMFDQAKWESQAREIVQALVDSGYSTTREIVLEIANELWNGGGDRVFDPNREFAYGVGSAYTTQINSWLSSSGFGSGGPGGFYFGGPDPFGGPIILALIKHHVEQVLIERGLSYNIKWAFGTQTVNADWTLAGIGGWMFAHEVLLGYSASDVLNNENPKLWLYGTSYTEGVFWDLYGAADNLTGLTGAANSAELLDRFDGTKPGYAADSSTLAQDVFDWFTGPSKQNNNQRCVDNHNDRKARCAAYNVNWGGDYEGGDHDTNLAIPEAVRFSPRTNSLGQTFTQWYLSFKNSSLRADIVHDLYTKRIAADPNTWMCQYGNLGDKTVGNPWDWGSFKEPVTLEGAAILSYGRL